MPQTLSTPAISLRCRPWREQDLLVDAYTFEQGKVSLLVRGGMRLSSKLAAHLEPFTLLELMVITGRGFPTAASASSRNCYPLLKGDYEKIAAAGWAIGRFNKLVQEGVRDDALFHLLTDFFALLNEAKAESAWYQWLAKMFLVFALQQLGHGLPFEAKKNTFNSLYEAASAKLSRTEFETMNKRLDLWLPAALENAV